MVLHTENIIARVFILVYYCWSLCRLPCGLFVHHITRLDFYRLELLAPCSPRCWVQVVLRLDYLLCNVYTRSFWPAVNSQKYMLSYFSYLSESQHNGWHLNLTFFRIDNHYMHTHTKSKFTKIIEKYRQFVSIFLCMEVIWLNKSMSPFCGNILSSVD